MLCNRTPTVHCPVCSQLLQCSVCMVVAKQPGSSVFFLFAKHCILFGSRRLGDSSSRPTGVLTDNPESVMWLQPCGKMRCFSYHVCVTVWEVELRACAIMRHVVRNRAQLCATVPNCAQLCVNFFFD